MLHILNIPTHKMLESVLLYIEIIKKERKFHSNATLNIKNGNIL